MVVTNSRWSSAITVAITDAITVAITGDLSVVWMEVKKVFPEGAATVKNCACKFYPCTLVLEANWAKKSRWVNVS